MEDNLNKARAAQILALYGVVNDDEIEKGKTFHIGQLDKSGKNVKTADGWKPIKTHAHLITTDHPEANHLGKLVSDKHPSTEPTSDQPKIDTETEKDISTWDKAKSDRLAQMFISISKNHGPNMDVSYTDRTRQDETFEWSNGTPCKISGETHEVVRERNGDIVYKTGVDYWTQRDGKDNAGFSKDETKTYIGRSAKQLSDFFKTQPKLYENAIYQAKNLISRINDPEDRSKYHIRRELGYMVSDNQLFE